MRIILLSCFVLSLSACKGGVEDLKSPCVGAEESPCDRRAPVNQGQA